MQHFGNPAAEPTGPSSSNCLKRACHTKRLAGDQRTSPRGESLLVFLLASLSLELLLSPHSPGRWACCASLYALYDLPSLMELLQRHPGHEESQPCWPSARHPSNLVHNKTEIHLLSVFPWTFIKSNYRLDFVHRYNAI